MSKKKICLIAQFPPPIHGLSKAVDTLYKSDEMNQEFDLKKIDITNNKKFLSNYKAIKNCDADLFYLTISQSVRGNIRDLLILRLLRNQGKKCLIHLHGGYFRKLYENDMKPIQRRWNEAALKKIDGSIVLGNSLKYIFEGLVDDNKIFVVPNCVDDDYLLSDVSMKPNQEPYHILYLSNFIRSKGYDIVLEMAKEYKNHTGNKNLHFDFAGKFYGEDEKQFFETFVRENSLEGVLTYHGIVDGDKKRELLRNSTFFILPTNYPKEGQPISILEAMGNGMIILTTNHAGIQDIVENDKNGYVVPWSRDLISEYLEYINCLDDYAINEIQRRNYELVKGRYLEDSYIDNLRLCFNSVMNQV